MYWNSFSSYMILCDSTINRNMRCIETPEYQNQSQYVQLINRNMRCIETIFLLSFKKGIKLINRNMRCIETLGSLAYWLFFFDKP